MNIESIGSIGSNSKYDSLEFGYQLNVKAKSTVHKKDVSRLCKHSYIIVNGTNELHYIR